MINITFWELRRKLYGNCFCKKLHFLLFILRNSLGLVNKLRRWKSDGSPRLPCATSTPLLLPPRLLINFRSIFLLLPSLYFSSVHIHSSSPPPGAADTDQPLLSTSTLRTWLRLRPFYLGDDAIFERVFRGKLRSRILLYRLKSSLSFQTAKSTSRVAETFTFSKLVNLKLQIISMF